MIDIIISFIVGCVLGVIFGAILTCVMCALIVSKPTWNQMMKEKPEEDDE